MARSWQVKAEQMRVGAALCRAAKAGESWAVEAINRITQGSTPRVVPQGSTLGSTLGLSGLSSLASKTTKPRKSRSSTSSTTTPPLPGLEGGRGEAWKETEKLVELFRAVHGKPRTRVTPILVKHCLSWRRTHSYADARRLIYLRRWVQVWVPESRTRETWSGIMGELFRSPWPPKKGEAAREDLYEYLLQKWDGTMIHKEREAVSDRGDAGLFSGRGEAGAEAGAGRAEKGNGSGGGPDSEAPHPSGEGGAGSAGQISLAPWGVHDKHRDP